MWHYGARWRNFPLLRGQIGHNLGQRREAGRTTRHVWRDSQIIRCFEKERKKSTHSHWSVTAVPSLAKAHRYPVHFPSIILWSRWKHGIIFGGGMEKTTADYGQHSLPLAAPWAVFGLPLPYQTTFGISDCNVNTRMCFFTLSLRLVQGNWWLPVPREECVTMAHTAHLFFIQ